MADITNLYQKVKENLISTIEQCILKFKKQNLEKYTWICVYDKSNFTINDLFAVKTIYEENYEELCAFSQNYLGIKLGKIASDEIDIKHPKFDKDGAYLALIVGEKDYHIKLIYGGTGWKEIPFPNPSGKPIILQY